MMWAFILLTSMPPFLKNIRLHAQMPDWLLVRDSEGNRYYMAPTGRLYLKDKPEQGLKPVSREGLEYWFTTGKELLREGKKADGLRIMKSILALSPEDGKVARFQKMASKEINRVIRFEGDRFGGLNEKAAIIFIKSGNDQVIVNDVMRYHIRISGSMEVLRSRARNSKGYKYHGLLIGVRFIVPINTKIVDGYDYLIGIDSEHFHYPQGTLAVMENNWRKNLGPDTFRRIKIYRDDERVVYEIDDNASSYAGLESFIVRGRQGYCIRLLTAKKVFQDKKGELLKVIKAIRTI